MLLLKSKSPGEVKFYEFDWAAKRLLPGELIVDSGWEVTGGTVEVADDPAPSVDNGITRVYLQGGELGDTCIVTNWVETNMNPRRDFSGKLRVKLTTE